MTFKTTPTLACIYQLFHKDNYEYLSDNLKKIVDEMDKSIHFDYEDAVNCALNLDHPKWNFVKYFLDTLKYLLKNGNFTDYLYVYKTNIDTNFLLDIFKKEAIELQKGNITVLHGKNMEFLVYDIFYQLVSGSYEGYKPKCQRKDDHPDEKAINLYNELFQIKKNDNDDDVRKRVISGNITLLNNIFHGGESTLLDYLYFNGSQLYPIDLLKNMNLSKKSLVEIIKYTNKISKQITNSILVLYSIPITKMDIYVYPSKPLGFRLGEYNIKEFYDLYLNKTPWKKYFDFFQDSQVRIIDLCLTKYGYQDGIRVYQMIDIPQKKLDKILKEIESFVLSDIDLIERLSSQIDLPKKKKKTPLKSIKGYETTLLKEKVNKESIRQYIEGIKDIIVEDYEKIPYFEKKMIKTPNDVMFYASEIIMGRFKEGEKTILSKGTYEQIKEYEKKYFNGFWEEAQPILFLMELTQKKI
jgi:hypothetical protein